MSSIENNFLRRFVNDPEDPFIPPTSRQRSVIKQGMRQPKATPEKTERENQRRKDGRRLH